jgi:cystathionine beta-lyase
MLRSGRHPDVDQDSGTAVDGTLERLRAGGSLKWSLHPDAIGAFVAEADIGTAPAVAAALHAAVDAGRLGYLPEHLVAAMAQAWCGFSRSRGGWDVPAERVRPLGDVVAGLRAAIEHFSAPGSPVIVPTPAYMPFLYVPQTLGREVVQVPMVEREGRLTHDLDGIAAAYDAGAGLLLLCNPQNPLGRVFTREELSGLAEVVDRAGGRVFADEIHAPLVYDGHRHVCYASLSPVAAGHTVTATSASKAWNVPGVKCAQLVLSNDADAETWNRVGLEHEHGTSILGVVAATAAYTDGVPWLDEALGHLDGSRRLLGDLLEGHLPDVGYHAPEGTYLAWLDLRPLGLGDHPAEWLLAHAGVALTDGTRCGEAGAGFARYTFATPRPVMARTVEQVARAVRGRGSR